MTGSLPSTPRYPIKLCPGAADEPGRDAESVSARCDQLDRGPVGVTDEDGSPRRRVASELTLFGIGSMALENLHAGSGEFSEGRIQILDAQRQMGEAGAIEGNVSCKAIGG